jgi:hypothetical protein
VERRTGVRRFAEGPDTSAQSFRVFSEKFALIGTYSYIPDSFTRPVTLLQNDRIEVTDEYGLHDCLRRDGSQRGLKKLIDPSGNV